MTYTKETLQEAIVQKLRLNYGCTEKQATDGEIMKACALVLRDIMAERGVRTREEVDSQEKRKVHYMSMEFLMGRSLMKNAYNLELLEPLTGAVEALGFKAADIFDMEPDAGLGNGGLGRLAACYLDSMTTLEIPATGYSICYELGIFKQKIIDGWQMEFPDNWLEMGDVWLHPRKDDAVEVRFGGQVHEWMDGDKFKTAQTGYQSVIAVPHDLYISGYGSKAVNKLTLWSASMPQSFDMNAFSRGDYVRALEQNTMAEAISKVLYPADDHINGKRLRLRQQYLLVSSSLQSILNEHLKNYHTLDNLADKVAVHINDTHPALCVPELMRLLVDEHDYGWDRAWEITCATLSYTNHTVMAEALERWPVSLFQEQLPRIYSICQEINRRLMEKLQRVYPNDPGKWNYMAVIANDEVRMANLCLTCCHKINGVSQLHTDILEKTIFRDYYNLDHSRFLNITNGIAYRRWLCQSNPALSGYLQTLIGDGFLKDANALEALEQYRGDLDVLENLRAIKRKNKVRLAAYIAEHNGVNVDPDSIFDVQVKRLHEYKRQLLNVLYILTLYNEIKDHPEKPVFPQTFIFAAKASAGYYLAKQIISLIVAVSNLVNSDPQVQGKLKVVFIEDYKVSLAEIIIPAADLSEQISVAGKEASGTSNMKLMINGAVTLGTLDGANVEIRDRVGDDNMFLFGMTADEVQALWQRGYDPHQFLTPELDRVLQMLTSGALGQRFDDVAASLLTPRFGAADSYMTVADFESYKAAKKRAVEVYQDRTRFAQMSLTNIARAGIFSSDRSVEQYAKEIWDL